MRYLTIILWIFADKSSQYSKSLKRIIFSEVNISRTTKLRTSFVRYHGGIFGPVYVKKTAPANRDINWPSRFRACSVSPDLSLEVDWVKIASVSLGKTWIPPG